MVIVGRRNALGNIPGFIVAPLSIFLRRVTGSWGTQFALAGAIYAITGMWYAKVLSLKPARDMLAERRNCGGHTTA